MLESARIRAIGQGILAASCGRLDLTFGRSASAVSPAAGGLPANHCPSRGAPLDLDENGACRYWNGIVTAGRHDWVLIGWRQTARQVSSWVG